MVSGNKSLTKKVKKLFSMHIHAIKSKFLETLRTPRTQHVKFFQNTIMKNCHRSWKFGTNYENLVPNHDILKNIQTERTRGREPNSKNQ